MSPQSLELRSLLLVEDDPVLREVVGDFLIGEGYVVFAAQDGHEAWRFMRELAPSLSYLVTDVRMPNLDGIELVRRVCRESRFAGRILLTSMWIAEERERVDALRDEIELLRESDRPRLSLLPKPFAPQTLRKALLT